MLYLGKDSLVHRLAAEAWADGEEQQGAEPVETVQGPIRELSLGLQGKSHLLPPRANDRVEEVEGVEDLGLEGQEVGARLDELVDVQARLGDHEVRIELHPGARAESLDRPGTERDVRGEPSVDDVEVDLVGAAPGGDVQASAKVAQVVG